jgi:cysteinyl-tRNA synthetase
METADQRVKQLRRHVAEWGEASTDLGVAGKDFDARFREAVASDLDLPTAVRVVNDLDHSTDVPPGEKRALFASWDHVLGLDLEREARAGWEPTEEIQRLVAERDGARAAKDYARSDELRDELQAMGLEVMDAPQGTRVRPRD